ncbi:MAG: thioredoxin family protein [Planctomycetota bacterium]
MSRHFPRFHLPALGFVCLTLLTLGCRTPGMGDFSLAKAFAPPPMLPSDPEADSLAEPVVEDGADGVSMTLGDAPPAALWTNNYQEALSQAASEGKQVLAFFTGSDFCQPCMQLHREVLATPEFENWARDRFVLLELDYPKRTPLSPELAQQNQELLTHYSVRRFPTVLVLSPQGEVVGKSNGYLGGGPDAWTADVDSQVLR